MGTSEQLGEPKKMPGTPCDGLTTHPGVGGSGTVPNRFTLQNGIQIKAPALISLWLVRAVQETGHKTSPYMPHIPKPLLTRKGSPLPVTLL